MTTIDPITTAPAPTTAAPANTFSIVSLVLAITGIALGQGVLSLGAIILGFVARSREPQAISTANWGLALGFVGLFGGVILAIFAFFGLAPLFLLGSLPFWGFWG